MVIVIVMVGSQTSVFREAGRKQLTGSTHAPQARCVLSSRGRRRSATRRCTQHQLSVFAIRMDTHDDVYLHRQRAGATSYFPGVVDHVLPTQALAVVSCLVRPCTHCRTHARLMYISSVLWKEFCENGVSQFLIGSAIQVRKRTTFQR